ncbi:MAG TPA: type II toxin-antitoxin system VapC family toxin [Tetrasphaera sp.]|uniref:type II toxin-antitoxin system VapC family toxin n=1 Tax=Nostocoides sp. TaxID=1917966 RepID=UPI002BCA1B92|nr:type II toxin-antitoxin system VapC family toxin [Tetrasphaera sp.]HNQ08284.1 type II toxin-antitoxin system VapC family toxin [Tetrasphaera sp.]
MIVDTSAIIAVLKDEADAPHLTSALVGAQSLLFSAASYLEAGIVIDSPRDPTLSRRLDELLEDFDITVVPVTPEQARIARDAYRDFGRGSGHPARLTFGDCFSYALASERREPLLFKGDDFGHTDVRSALTAPD